MDPPPWRRCWSYRQKHEERQEKAAAKARKRLEKARAAPVLDVPGHYRGEEGSPLELVEKAVHLGCPPSPGNDVSLDVS
ncbi:hypothetical protein [Kitasatospora sp. NPDC001683]